MYDAQTSYLFHVIFNKKFFYYRFFININVFIIFGIKNDDKYKTNSKVVLYCISNLLI